jgi:hypothetical protein
MAGEKPVKTLESRRTLVRIHGGIVAAVCDRRKKFKWRTAVTDRCYSERCRPDEAGERGGAGGCKDFAPDGARTGARWKLTSTSERQTVTV